MKIGIIGAGMMAQVGHLPFIFANEQVAVRGVVESRESNRNYISSIYGQQKYYSDYRDLLAADVDYIVLSAPRPSVLPISKHVLDAGLGLITEKPAAHKLDDAYALNRLVQTNSNYYFACYMKRYDKGVEIAKKMVDELKASNEYGQLRSINFCNHNVGYCAEVPPHFRPIESSPIRYPISKMFPDYIALEKRVEYEWFNNAISHDINLVSYFLQRDIIEAQYFHVENFRGNGNFKIGDVNVSFDVSKTQHQHWREEFEFIFDGGNIRLILPSPMATDQTAKIITNLPMEIPVIDKVWCFENQAINYLNVKNPKSDIKQVIFDYQIIQELWKIAK